MTQPISAIDGERLSTVVPTGSTVRINWRRGFRPAYMPTRATYTYVGSSKTHHEFVGSDGEWFAIVISDTNGLTVVS
jgi:hypothetical protein